MTITEVNNHDSNYALIAGLRKAASVAGPQEKMEKMRQERKAGARAHMRWEAAEHEACGDLMCFTFLQSLLRVLCRYELEKGQSGWHRHRSGASCNSPGQRMVAHPRAGSRHGKKCMISC